VCEQKRTAQVEGGKACAGFDDRPHPKIADVRALADVE
jgi:hypothetical protein